VTTDGTRVYQAIAGPGGRMVAFSLSSASRVWSKSTDGDVQAVVVQDGVVYAGGHFTYFTNVKRRQLAAVTPNKGELLSYTVGFAGSDSPGIWAINADVTALRIGGGFTLANQSGARYAAFPTAL
jgi:hypothetical protein